MNIDYSINLGGPSVKSLIATLQKIVDDNPEINFHKVGVNLLTADVGYSGVELDYWEHNGKRHVRVEVF